MTNNIVILILRILKKIRLLTLVKIVVPIKYNNLRALIPINKGIGYPNIFIEKDSLWSIYEVLYDPAKGVFVDVGTNIGQTLLKLKSLNTKIMYLGFEPNVTCYNYLLSLIKINGFEGCNLENLALSDKKQELLLGINEATDASASLVSNLRPGYFTESILINSILFDDFENSQKVAFVKIDVEGAELDVLMGMKKTIEKFHPIIVCEVLDSFSATVLDFTQNRAYNLCDLLSRLGYNIIQLEQNGKKLKSFKKIDIIKIRQWTLESYNLNDYVFCHKSSQADVENKLAKICSQ